MRPHSKAITRPRGAQQCFDFSKNHSLRVKAFLYFKQNWTQPGPVLGSKPSLIVNLVDKEETEEYRESAQTSIGTPGNWSCHRRSHIAKEIQQVSPQRVIIHESWCLVCFYKGLFFVHKLGRWLGVPLSFTAHKSNKWERKMQQRTWRLIWQLRPMIRRTQQGRSHFFSQYSFVFTCPSLRTDQ